MVKPTASYAAKVMTGGHTSQRLARGKSGLSPPISRVVKVSAEGLAFQPLNLGCAPPQAGAISAEYGCLDARTTKIYP